MGSNQVEFVSFKELLMGIRNEETRRLVSGFLQKLVQRMRKDREKIEELVLTSQGQGGINDENVLGLMSDIFGTTGDSGGQWGSQEQHAIESSSDPTPGSSHVKKLRRSVRMSVQRQKKMEGSKEKIRDGPNPLLQPPILAVLFKKVPLEDLEVCRLVCKTWHVESLSSWWANATLKFELEEIITRPQDSTSPTTLEQYLDFCEEECSTTPFKQLHISEWNFKVGDANQTRFFDLLGPHLTSLTFDRCSFDGRDTVRSIIYQKFPKLQFLKMEDCDVYTSDEYENSGFYEEPAGEVVAYQEPAFGVHGLKSLILFDCLPDSMLELLSHFHMLDDVSLTSFFDYDLLALLKTVKLVREQHPNKLPLRKFKAALIFIADKEPVKELAELNLLQELNLPLGTLKISTRGRDSVWNLEQFEEIIRDILRKHSSTLRQIDASDARVGFQGILREFPFGHQLNNLQRVKVKADFFSNLNWLVNTKNLQDLEIWRGDDFDPSSNVISNSSQQLGNWSLPSLKRLRIDFPVSAVNLRKLIRWLPGVESLYMELDDENFAIICAHWKQLKKLTIWGDQLTDKGVTGIWMDSGLPDEETRIPANILQLKSLKSFSARSSIQNLTQKSVSEGLLRLPSLVRVDLDRHSQIDAEAIAALKEKGISVNRDW